MTFRIDNPFEIDSHTTYTCKGYHRGQPTEHKSVWVITPTEEIDCFKQTLDKQWINHMADKSIGWGFIKNSGFIRIGIGTTPEHRELFYAKFIDGNNNCQWHGYPADYKRIGDRVSLNISKRWRTEGIITKHEFSRLMRGIGI